MREGYCSLCGAWTEHAVRFDAFTTPSNVVHWDIVLCPECRAAQEGPPALAMAAAERERHHARGARAVDERTTERMMADALQWWEAVWDRDL